MALPFKKSFSSTVSISAIVPSAGASRRFLFSGKTRYGSRKKDNAQKNINAKKKQAHTIAGAQKSALAEAGIDVGFGVSLDITDDTYSSMVEEISIMQEEADYEALSIRMGADNLKDKASDVSTAGTVNAVGTLLGGVTRAFSIGS